jgi:hypothetical protein
MLAPNKPHNTKNTANPRLIIPHIPTPAAAKARA